MENGNESVRGLKYIQGNLQKKEGGKTVRIVDVFHLYFQLSSFSVFSLFRLQISLLVVHSQFTILQSKLSFTNLTSFCFKNTP